MAAARTAAAAPARHAVAAGNAALDELAASGMRRGDALFAKAAGLYVRGRYTECRDAVAGLVLNDPTNERYAAMLEVLRETVGTEGTAATTTKERKGRNTEMAAKLYWRAEEASLLCGCCAFDFTCNHDSCCLLYRVCEALTVQFSECCVP